MTVSQSVTVHQWGTDLSRGRDVTDNNLIQFGAPLDFFLNFKTPITRRTINDK